VRKVSCLPCMFAYHARDLLRRLRDTATLSGLMCCHGMFRVVRRHSNGIEKESAQFVRQDDAEHYAQLLAAWRGLDVSVVVLDAHDNPVAVKSGDASAKE